MATTRFSTLRVLPATLLAASLVRASEDCIITRPGGVKEPGVTNNCAFFPAANGCQLATVCSIFLVVWFSLALELG